MLIAFISVCATLGLLIYGTGCVVAYGLLTDPELVPLSRRRIWVNTLGSWITVLAFSQDSPTDGLLWLWLLGICLFAASGDAWADAIARKGEDWMVITNKPCEDAKVIEGAKKRGVDPADLRAAHGRLSGTMYQACWYRIPKYVQLFYDDEDTGFIDARLFVSTPEV